MLKSGNSSIQSCVNNLLRLARGEVPIDQLRGLRADITDMPESLAMPYLYASAYWVVENYEPRASFNQIDIVTGSAEGDFTFTPQIS